MKEKTLNKETVTTEETRIVSQETICGNISNLSSALSSLSDLDTALYDKVDQEKLLDAKLNILSSIHYMSNYLRTSDV